MLASYAAKWTDETRKAIQLLTNETWRQAKDRVRPNHLVQRPIPKLLPPRMPENLELSYPKAMQWTVGPKYPGMLKACIEAKKRKDDFLHAR